MLASCAQAAGSLRAALDTYHEEAHAELVDATSVVLDHIPLGSPIEEAQAVLSAAGFGPGKMFDMGTAETVGYRSDADTYFHFGLTASSVIVMWTTYSVDLGVKDGVVVFLDASIRVSSL
jgi:hypothetical protein